MQVMQSTEFEKTDVLVGQVAPTQNFGVSDDPMLMSMLSTGFYGNPLRTMIQEIMFNAWDAHRMGDCLDKPIDIYINETTGLIIRDYGPGIPDSEIHGVYCIYGGSTKRGDKRQTGGFGLGSKSPFAYSESFTVTSMNQHNKCMYLVSRVSEDGGKPGLTRLINVATTETGLMVTVPLEAGDRKTAKEYIYDVLFLSGINANVHYMNDPVKNVQSKSLIPGEYVLEVGNSSRDRGIYAVYGGVRYTIPEHKDYSDEYVFLQLMSNICPLYIGFAPDTLTPLPNREGLNMSQKCRDAVRIGLEVCMERFRTVIDPLLQAFLRQVFDNFITRKVEPQFAMFMALSLQHHEDQVVDMIKFSDLMLPLVPLNSDPSMWAIALKLFRHSPKAIIEIIGYKTWIKNIALHFIRCYPNHKDLAFHIMKQSSNDVLHTRYGTKANSVESQLANLVNREFFQELFAIENEIKAQFPEDDSLHLTLRYNDDSSGTWSKLSRQKIRLHERFDAKTRKDIKSKVVSLFQNPVEFYDYKGNLVESLLHTKTILLGKTTACLSQTSLPMMYSYRSHNHEPILACVAYSRKGVYETAKKLFLDRGFNVIEAIEPVKAERKTVAEKKQAPTYCLYNPSQGSWSNYDQQISDPTHVYYQTEGILSDTSYHIKSQKPSRQLMAMMAIEYPKLVIVHNITQQKSLMDRGVLSFETGFSEFAKKLTTKKYRMRNIVRAIHILNGSHMPYCLVQQPEIQKVFGMVPIEPDDKEAFWDEFHIYKEIIGSEYRGIFQDTQKVKQLIKDVWKNDPQAQKIQQKIESTFMFYETKLEHKFVQMEPANKPAFLDKLVKFIQ